VIRIIGVNAATLSIAAMLAGGAQLASAAQVTFTDRTTFLGSVTGAANFDFEIPSGFPAAVAPLSSFAAGEVITTTTGGAAAVDIQQFGNGFGQAIGGRGAGGDLNNFLPVLMTFSSPKFAVGFDDLDLTGSGTAPTEFAIIHVSFSDGTPTQTYTVSETDANFATAAFFGIVSSNPISSIEVFSADSPGGAPNTRANMLDNVVLANPVPEPKTWLALILGLGLFTFHRAFAQRAL
jgi:hypothetical protein